MKARDLVPGMTVRTSSAKWRRIEFISTPLRKDPDHHIRLQFTDRNSLWTHPERDFDQNGRDDDES